MTFQPRIALLALAIATTLAACSEDNPPVITGENTLVNNASFSVLDTNGDDLTAVNQDNFPLPNELPISSVSNGSGVTQGPVLGGASSATDADVDPDADPDADPDVDPDADPDADSQPDLGAATEEVSQPSSDFFQLDGAIEYADQVGVEVAPVLESIASLVVGEYEIASGSVVFSDAITEIAKRLTPGCDSGTLESALNLNGTTITDGTIEFTACERANAVVDGVLQFETVETAGVESLEITFDRTTVTNDNAEVLLIGLMSLEFVGDEVRLTSENFTMQDELSRRHWERVTVAGRVSSVGSRHLRGVATRVDDVDNTEVKYTFSDVDVAPADDFPNAGSQLMEHTDGSSLEIEYGPGGGDGNNSFTYQVVPSNSPTALNLGIGSEGDVRTRVPFY